MNKRDLGLWLEHLGFAAEVRFRGRSGKRRFRFDWALEAPHKLAVEYDGTGVGHQSVSGTWADTEKSNEATVCGWRVIRCNAMTTRTGLCQEWVEAAMTEG